MMKRMMALAVAAISGCQKQEAPPPVTGTALNSIVIRHYADVPAPEADGGAFASMGETVILATGDGAFYLVRDRSVRPLDIPPPFDRAAFFGDWREAEKKPRLRLTGAVLSQERLFAAHQAWNGTERCFTMRVSSVALGADLAATGPWETVYDTVPCLPFKPPFDDSETGGHLARTAGGELLLTVGDHGFSGLDGSEPLAQSDGDYGKILKIEPEGTGRTILSRGHRNAQGIAVAADGRIWSDEHGPQGGDELNLILPGKNYGWPLVTYGTNYGATAWPLNPEGRNHGAFEEPAIAFVPSIAASALIEIRGDEFPEWRGDLLIGSLRTKALFRTRLTGDRVAYIEPIPAGERIRDLVSAPDGKILIWADRGAIFEVARADAGGAYARYCAGCHSPDFGRPAGPPLDGVIGRPVAGVEGFAYSAALTAKGGNWTEDSLSAFLADPEAFAPGTTMRLPPLDEAARTEIIDFLRG